MALTYPCSINGRFVELTTEEIAYLEWKRQTVDQRLIDLLERVKALEAQEKKK